MAAICSLCPSIVLDLPCSFGNAQHHENQNRAFGLSKEGFVWRLRAPSLQDFLLKLANPAWIDDYFHCTIQMDHHWCITPIYFNSFWMVVRPSKSFRFRLFYWKLLVLLTLIDCFTYYNCLWCQHLDISICASILDDTAPRTSTHTDEADRLVCFSNKLPVTHHRRSIDGRCMEPRVPYLL